MSKKVAEVIVDTLEAAGVKNCYGIVGDTLNLIAGYIQRSGIDWVHMRHEEAGAFAAQAEAQLMGQLGPTVDETSRMGRLQTWLKGLVQSPVLLLHERVDGVRSELGHEVETLRRDMEHRAYRMEVRIAAWGVTVGMLIICGLFFLMGLWLGLNEFIGPIGASFALAALFGLLAVVPLFLLPRELARVEASHPRYAK